MFKQIKWAWQRVFREWDDAALWGLDSHFERVIIPPLKKFCEGYMQLDEERHRLNPERTHVCKMTLELIEEYEQQTDIEMLYGTKVKKVAVYFAENIGYYWD